MKYLIALAAIAVAVQAHGHSLARPGPWEIPIRKASPFIPEAATPAATTPLQAPSTSTPGAPPWNVETAYNFGAQRKEVIAGYRWFSVPNAIGRKQLDFKALGGFDSSMIPIAGAYVATQWHLFGPFMPGNFEVFIGGHFGVGQKPQPFFGGGWILGA